MHYKTLIHVRGFTLIELLVVVAIIGLLASTVLASLSTVRETARDSQRLQEARQLINALELYRNQNGRYPCSGVALNCAPGTVGGAAGLVVKSNTTYSAFATTFRNGLFMQFNPDATYPSAIVYRLRSTSSDNNGTDPTSYTIIVRQESTGTFCKINVGPGHSAYQIYSNCPVQAV